MQMDLRPDELRLIELYRAMKAHKFGTLCVTVHNGRGTLIDEKKTYEVPGA